MKEAHGSMHLFIDTHVRGRIRLAMIPSDVHQKIIVRDAEGVRDVVRAADAFFGPYLGRACGIIVVAGPGSFSAIRSGVLVANLMSRLMDVPLYHVDTAVTGENGKWKMENGREKMDLADLDFIRRQIIDGRLKPVSYVAPVYDQEPNITVSRM